MWGLMASVMLETVVMPAPSIFGNCASSRFYVQKVSKLFEAFGPLAARRLVEPGLLQHSANLCHRTRTKVIFGITNLASFSFFVSPVRHKLIATARAKGLACILAWPPNVQ